MRVLIAEDEKEIAQGLKFLLEKQKFAVDIVHDGVDAIDFFESTHYDVVVLDIMMPRKDGLAVLREIRKGPANPDVPILMLTAKAELEDRVAGLEAGADDYLPKPFATAEFLARVKALSRRNSGFTGNNIEFGGTTLNCDKYELSCSGKSLLLNNKEYQMAELFFRNPHIVFSTDKLMERIWGLDSEAEIAVVWTYIGFVRKKLKEIGSGVEIKTVRGAGYLLEEIK